MVDMEDFLRERTEALLSLDIAKINAYLANHGSVTLPNNEMGWCAIHKARTGITDFPEQEKEISRQWLKERGYKSLS